MIRTALTYTEGLRIGSFIDGKTPFAPNTYRVENGVITAGDGCGRAELTAPSWWGATLCAGRGGVKKFVVPSGGRSSNVREN